MAEPIPIFYGEFHDWPRMVRFAFEGRWYFLNCPFDDELDDYPDSYEVYRLPFGSEAAFEANPYWWRDLSDAVRLGRVPVAAVGLDETRRRGIDADKFAGWLF